MVRSIVESWVCSFVGSFLRSFVRRLVSLSNPDRGKSKSRRRNTTRLQTFTLDRH